MLLKEVSTIPVMSGSAMEWARVVMLVPSLLL